MKIKVEPMRCEDLPEIMALEMDTFTSPWSERLFKDEFEGSFSHIFTARLEDGRLAGFICFWVLIDEVHILNLAVTESLRRRGIGRALVREALKYALGHGAASATLEVREKNFAAIEFYVGIGFKRVCIRKNYYDSPADNAVIMWLYDIPGALQKMP